MKIYGGRVIYDCKPKEMPNLLKDIETGKVKPAETRPFYTRNGRGTNLCKH